MTQDGHSRSIWEERIADLRRYDLDNLESEPVDPASLTSWPIPGLTFVRVDGILRSWDIEREKQQQGQNVQQDPDPTKPPKRMYLMEDALTGLHSQKANLAFLVLGDKSGVHYYMGISLPSAVETTEPGTDPSSICYNSLKSILHSVYGGVDVFKKPFSAEEMHTMIKPMTKYTGVVTGIPALKSTAGDTTDSEQIERLAAGLQGIEFGMLILAVPIPSKNVTREETAVVDQIQRAQTHVRQH